MLMGIIRFAFIVACLSVATTARADVKVKSRQTMQGQTYEHTTYIKGKRQRAERADGQLITITQCDLRRDVQIMPQAQAYTVSAYDQTEVAPDTGAKSSPDAREKTDAARTAGGGVVTMTVTTRDTGERKQMFGHTARRIITTMITDSTPDACSPQKNKMETDGWYIDAAFQLTCDAERYKNYRPAANRAGCLDRYETKQLGSGKRGYPVWEKMTMYDEAGRETMSFVTEVVELSNATLDAALFEVPAGYREVKDFSQAYAAMNNSANDDDDNDAPANNASGSDANARRQAGQTSDAASASLGAKKEGVVRLGLATVTTGAVVERMNASDLASAIGNSLSAHLKAPNLEVVRLEAQLPAQIELEATQKECDFVIYTNVSHKKGGGGMFGKALGGIASSAVGHVAYGGSAGSAAARPAATTTVSAASLSANVKSKDEITLELKLQAPNGASPAVTKQLKAKAKSDGEDIISPLVEQAAQAIVDAAV